jgi:hypothetical protein
MDRVLDGRHDSAPARLVTQGAVLVTERLHLAGEPEHLRMELASGEATPDVAGAVPVVGRDRHRDHSLHHALPGPVRQGLNRFGGVRRVLDAGASVHLQATLSGVVHDDEGHPVPAGAVARGDVLQVAFEVGPAERHIVQHPQEAGRPSPYCPYGQPVAPTLAR